MSLWISIAPPDKRTNGRRRGVENRDLVFSDQFPETIQLRPIRSSLIHKGGRSIAEGPVNDIAVPCHPANIGRAPIKIILMQIEYVLRSDRNTKQVATGCVQDPFWLTGRSARVKNEQRIFGVERFRLTL